MNQGITWNAEHISPTGRSVTALVIPVNPYLNTLASGVAGRVFTRPFTTMANAYVVTEQERNQLMPERGERRLVNIYLNRELYLTAKANAAKQDITMQEWVEDALRRKLKSDGVEVEQDHRTSPKD